MKITEIDFYSRKKLTQNQELSMKVIFLPRKARKSSEFFNYSNYAPIYTPPVFKNKMFWRDSYSQLNKVNTAFQNSIAYSNLQKRTRFLIFFIKEQGFINFWYY